MLGGNSKVFLLEHLILIEGSALRVILLGRLHTEAKKTQTQRDNCDSSKHSKAQLKVN